MGDPSWSTPTTLPAWSRPRTHPDWASIALEVGCNGTQWRQTAKGCSWRNGLAERVIRSARHTLSHELQRGALLDFHEFWALCATVSSIINSRPLSIRTNTSGDWHAVSPRDVLLGRSARSLQQSEAALDYTLDQGEGDTLDQLGQDQVQIVKAWREKWIGQVFGDMVGRSKWKSELSQPSGGRPGSSTVREEAGRRRVETGQGCVCPYLTRMDTCGLSRWSSVLVMCRTRGALTSPRNPQTMEVGVQRFAVLLPVEEQQEVQLPPQASGMTLN